MPTHMTVVLQFDDGEEKRIEYRPVASGDPAILERLESTGDPSDREIVTTFRPASDRPASYPADLPFIRGVRAHVNEFPGSGHPSRARWRVLGRSSRLFDEIQRQSTDAGWIPDPQIKLPGFPPSLRMAFLRRDDTVRRISQSQLSWFASLVELEDIPAALFDRRTS